MLKRLLLSVLGWLQRLLRIARVPEQLTPTQGKPPVETSIGPVTRTPVAVASPPEPLIPNEIILAGDTHGLLVRFSSESMLDKPVEIPRGARALAAAAPLVQHAVLSSDIIEHAIRTKRLVEIVGPPQALAQLKSGTLNFMRSKSDGNLLGSLVDGSNTIRNQARFQPVPPVHPAKVAGIAVFQVASVVTAQIHLADISKKLGSIKASVDEVLSRQQATVYGRVRGAIRRLEQLESAHHAGLLTLSGMQGDLATINQDITNSFYECVRNLHDYHSRFPGPLFGRAETRARITQLQELPGRPMVDFVTLLGLVDATARYYNVLMAVQAVEAPAALTHTRREADRALGEMIKEARWFADYVDFLRRGSRERYKQIKNQWFKWDEKTLTRQISTMEFPALHAVRELPEPQAENTITRVFLKPKEDGTVEAYVLPGA
ncbi:MAG: hypothetical protein ACOY93_03760 [Bacillota bacterium]